MMRKRVGMSSIEAFPHEARLLVGGVGAHSRPQISPRGRGDYRGVDSKVEAISL